MKAYSTKGIVAIAYTLVSVIGIILWIINPSETMIHFFGASSMIYCFLIAMSLGRCLVSYFALGWVVSYLPAIFVCSIIAIKRKNYIPFSATIVLELIVSLLMIGIKVYLKNYDSLPIALFGLGFRSVLCYSIIRIIRNMNSDTIE